jgi:LEA14-like dessication related protein
MLPPLYNNIDTEITEKPDPCYGDRMIKKRYVMILGLIVVILLGLVVLRYMVDAAAINDFKINIKQVNVTHIGLTSCDIIVTVNCTNPTTYDLPIAYATFNVYVADSYVGNSGVSAFTIPKKSSAEQQVSLTVLYTNLAHAVLEALLNNNYTINITGEAHGYVLYGLFTTTVPFTISTTHS